MERLDLLERRGAQPVHPPEVTREVARGLAADVTDAELLKIMKDYGYTTLGVIGGAG